MSNQIALFAALSEEQEQIKGEMQNLKKQVEYKDQKIEEILLAVAKSEKIIREDLIGKVAGMLAPFLESVGQRVKNQDAETQRIEEKVELLLTDTDQRLHAHLEQINSEASALVGDFQAAGKKITADFSAAQKSFSVRFGNVEQTAAQIGTRLQELGKVQNTLEKGAFTFNQQVIGWKRDAADLREENIKTTHETETALKNLKDEIEYFSDFSNKQFRRGVVLATLIAVSLLIVVGVINQTLIAGSAASEIIEIKKYSAAEKRDLELTLGEWTMAFDKKSIDEQVRLEHYNYLYNLLTPQQKKDFDKLYSETLQKHLKEAEERTDRQIAKKIRSQ